MDEQNDISDLNNTIDPKSVQLNYDDLAVASNMIIKVTDVKKGSKDQPISIEFEGMEGRPYKPCLTMRRALIAAWGSDGSTWIGRSIKLYADHSVKFGGALVGGIRISALSDIDKPIRLLLSTSRAKRAELNIGVLSQPQSYPEQKFMEKYPQWVQAINDGKVTIDEVIEKIGILTNEQIEIIKGEINNG